MRLLIDECLPRALKRLLRGHTCRTVQEMAWSGIKNGALLSLAEADFDAFRVA
jgi:predicted nuclease of predicted toxin-antitoxin system